MSESKIGRPRSEKSREAILNAIDALLEEKEGRDLTIEAVAKRAKVGKPTLYRWWPTLADIVLEAGLRRAEMNTVISSEEGPQEKLRMFLRQSVKAITDGGGVYLRFLMAQAQENEEFRKRFRDSFVASRREVLCGVIREAVDYDKTSSTRNLDLFVDIVFGAMWYRLLVGHASLDQSFTDALVDIVLSDAKRSGA